MDQERSEGPQRKTQPRPAEETFDIRRKSYPRPWKSNVDVHRLSYKGRCRVLGGDFSIYMVSR